MLKKICFGVALVLSAVVTSLTVTTITAGIHEARAQSRAMQSAPAWVDHPNPLVVQQPTVQTKHELFSEDHTSDVVAVEQVWARMPTTTILLMELAWRAFRS